ncbi:MAG: hypothetical protein PHU93_03185, partial [Candidatus Gracilibacteria bacterium]|nr:hypothetical protein [Candidatus Gracilibacteria bacterium]
MKINPKFILFRILTKYKYTCYYKALGLLTALRWRKSFKLLQNTCLEGFFVHVKFFTRDEKYFFDTTRSE